MSEDSSPASVVQQVASRHGGLSGLAKAAQVTGPRAVAAVWAWTNRNNVPPEYAARIELLERGATTVEQLTRGVRWARKPNPDWPHPEGEPVIAVAPDVALHADVVGTAAA